MTPGRDAILPQQLRMSSNGTSKQELEGGGDAGLGQARGAELGHLEFLQTLCHDEIIRQELTAMGRAHSAPKPRWRSSASTPAPSCPPRRSATSPRCGWLHAGESVILYGPVGVG